MRTDLTLLCPSCAVRLPRVRACPRCKRTRLFDLRTAAGRTGALAALGRRDQEAPTKIELRLWRWGRWVVPLVCLAVAIAAYEGTKSPEAALLGAAMVFVVSVAIALLLFAAYGVISLLLEIWNALFALIAKKKRAAPALPRLLVAEPAPADASLARFAGRVRVLEPVASPLARKACAAYRVVGEGPLGQVDDGGGTTFELVSDDGTARVILGTAALDIPVATAPMTMRPDAELSRFLEQRGIFPERGPVRLAEGLIEDGDEVEVLGRPRTATETDGYRTQKDIAIFTETTDAPLYVRKL
jgi:hypothetical protein